MESNELKELITEAGYVVTKDGKVISTLTNWRGYGKRELTQDSYKNSYPVVYLTLKGNGKSKAYRVHKLVGLYHLPLKPSLKHEIRHLDGNKFNNHVDNLAWGTGKENAEDRERHGRTSRGLSHSIATKRGIQNKQALKNAGG